MIIVSAHNLSESYVRHVLGFENYYLNENKYSLVMNEAILREHLLSESWWSGVGDKAKEVMTAVKDKVKEKALEPLEALKEFGENAKGIVAALTAAVKDGKALDAARNMVDRSIKQLFSTRIIKNLRSIIEKLEQLQMPTFAKGLKKITDVLYNLRQKLFDIKGWKGLLSVLGFVLGIAYIEEKLGVTEKVLKVREMMLRPKDYFKGEVVEFIMGSEDAEDDEEDESVVGQAKDKIIDFLKEKFTEELAIVEKLKEQALEFVQKIAGKAIEQFAGPIAWVKQVGELFGSVSWVASKIGPILSKAGKGLQLERTLRGILLEDRCGALNPKLQGAIDQMIEHDLSVEYQQRPDQIIVRLLRPEAPIVVGTLRADKDPELLGACNDGFVVGNARVKPVYRESGLGALLYDVLVELAGDDGITADRTSVSDDAIRIWRYFHSSNDYTKKPLDDKKGTHTPDDPSDDCEASSYEDHDPHVFSWSKDDFQSHPLNNVYVKKDKSLSTYKCLSDIGRIKEKER